MPERFNGIDRIGWNSHVGEKIAQPAASAAGLKVATATVAAVVALAASDLIAGGLSVLLATPRNLTFTTAGSTPADAPANVVIVGTDKNDKAITETLNLAQTAAAVTSVNRYKTVTSITYPAADGTGATVAIGYAATADFSPVCRAVECTADGTVVFELPDGSQVSRAMVAGDVRDWMQISGFVSSSGTVEFFR